MAKGQVHLRRISKSGCRLTVRPPTGTAVGYGVGKAIEIPASKVLDPRGWWPPDWTSVGYGISKWNAPSPVPGMAGGVDSSASQEPIGNAVKDRCKECRNDAFTSTWCDQHAPGDPCVRCDGDSHRWNYRLFHSPDSERTIAGTEQAQLVRANFALCESDPTVSRGVPIGRIAMERRNRGKHVAAAKKGGSPGDTHWCWLDRHASFQTTIWQLTRTTGSCTT